MEAHDGGASPLPGEVIRHILKFCADQYEDIASACAVSSAWRAAAKMTAFRAHLEYLGVDIDGEKAPAPVMQTVLSVGKVKIALLPKLCL